MSTAYAPIPLDEYAPAILTEDDLVLAVDVLCARCTHDLDADGFCVACGATTIGGIATSD